MSLPAEVMEAVARQLEARLQPELDAVQVVPRFSFNPTPPCIDVYPADPALFQAGMASYEMTLLIRARVGYVDSQAAQELLLDFLDPHSDLSIRAALEDDPTFGGVVDTSGPEEGAPIASGFREYTYGDSVLLGCEWRLRVVLP